MMATKDEKHSEPTRSSRDLPARRPGRRVRRLESPSEMRGFRLTRNGTALGVGGPVPVAGGESLSEEDEDFSGEESARIEELLDQVGSEPNGVGGAGGIGAEPRAALERASQRVKGFVADHVTTSPGARQRATASRTLTLVVGGCFLGVAVAAAVAANHSPSPAPPAERETAVVATQAPSLSAPEPSIPLAATPSRVPPVAAPVLPRALVPKSSPPSPSAPEPTEDPRPLETALPVVASARPATPTPTPTATTTLPATPRRSGLVDPSFRDESAE